MGALNERQVWLMVNALREKAAGDREAISESKALPPEVDVLNGAAGAIAQTLAQQAVEAEAIADQLESASRVTVEG